MKKSKYLLRNPKPDRTHLNVNVRLILEVCRLPHAVAAQHLIETLPLPNDDVRLAEWFVRNAPPTDMLRESFAWQSIVREMKVQLKSGSGKVAT